MRSEYLIDRDPYEDEQEPIHLDRDHGLVLRLQPLHGPKKLEIKVYLNPLDMLQLSKLIDWLARKPQAGKDAGNELKGQGP
jgi:hypothetical protein